MFDKLYFIIIITSSKCTERNEIKYKNRTIRKKID